MRRTGAGAALHGQRGVKACPFCVEVGGCLCIGYIMRFLFFFANLYCLQWADTQVRPYDDTVMLCSARTCHLHVEFTRYFQIYRRKQGRNVLVNFHPASPAAVGADPCVRPAEPFYEFLPFGANSCCLQYADTQIHLHPYVQF